MLRQLCMPSSQADRRTLVGSESKTPSTLVAFRKAHAPISAARSAAAVSVLKKGLPEQATSRSCCSSLIVPPYFRPMRRRASLCPSCPQADAQHTMHRIGCKLA